MSCIAEDRELNLFLGASNLTLLLPHLLGHLRSVHTLGEEAAEQPRTVVAAAGHGRALTLPSRFFVRRLDPSLAACEPALDDAVVGSGRPRGPRRVLIMDLGLDLLYGASVEQLLGAIRRVLGNVGGGEGDEESGEEPPVIVIEQPPAERVTALSSRDFELLRRVFFPGHQVDRLQLLGGLRELDEALVELAREASSVVRLVGFADGFYGWDPIHVRAVRRREAARLLAQALDLESEGPAALSARERLSWAFAAWPAEMRVAGVIVNRRQPCWRSRGLTVVLC